jgi:hypothetical protein
MDAFSFGQKLALGDFCFQTPIWLENLLSARPSFLLLLPLVITFLLPHCHFIFTPRRTKERTNERAHERMNERTVTLPFSRHVPFAYHYQLFAYCIVPPSFDTRSATTMMTTIKTTKMLMATPPLPHVAQKGTLKNFKSKKHGKPSQFFLIWYITFL